MDIKKKVNGYFYRIYNRIFVPLQIRNHPKVFCIGMNKTGTTSFICAMKDLGYVVGDQAKGEQLLRDYRKNKFKRIIDYCRTAEVFQDVPFSLPKTYEYLDREFPKAKFILTVRDSSEQWYNSITKFHALRFGNGELPTSEQLKKADYIYPSYMWHLMQAICNSSEKNPYDKDLLMDAYDVYNSQVISYFDNRPKDFLLINLSNKDSYSKLVDFLGVSSPFKDFPWENKTNQFTKQ
ncbi:sulfotransferase [Acidiluteibacter ferrifornacis]|uniref:Sulfotransferase domain-containing protein n=1 Tax=Acidiluteibacter ferrifornacis TaxID=2692424 RepID=A0A6N9NQG4_9FLAO|nr:sulfotransferase [Acidiluteibacter ferrifornacis]NBG66645.1 hypothetical protein [Acidiluteibacter ferrifornacis]